MNTRKLQATGGSSLSLIIPKNWVKKNKLENKTQVFVQETRSGELRVKPLGVLEKTEKSIEVGKNDLENSKRKILSAYVGGFGDLNLKWADASKKERAELTDLVKSLMGWEIEQEDEENLVATYVLDYGKMPAAKVLQRIFDISIEVSQKADLKLKNEDNGAKKEIAKKTAEAEKLGLLMARIFRGVMNGKIDEKSVNLDFEQLFYYYETSKCLVSICKKTKAATSADDFGDYSASDFLDWSELLKKIMKVAMGDDSKFKEITDAYDKMTHHYENYYLDDVDSSIGEIIEIYNCNN